MNFFYIINGKKLKQLLIIVVAAFFTAGILYTENVVQLPVFSTKDGPRVIYKGEEKEKKIALTFNISWGDEKAIPILDTLKQTGIKNATFFVSGAWAERHPNVVKRIVDDGHELASMGYNYKNYLELEDHKVRQDIVKAEEVFKVLGVKHTKLLRPPTGNFDKRIVKIADSVGYTVVHWSVDSKDWMNPGIEAIIKNSTGDVEGGDIILLHASDSVKQTVKALPTIVQEIRKQGFQIYSVSELIANTKVKSKEIN